MSGGLGDLRLYYERELRYLRQRGADFAGEHPDVAARLALNEQESSDPHVERLVESFAFLTARIQRSLDLEAPEISSGLLGVLCPQLVDPIPSMSVAQFRLDGSEGKVMGGFPLGVGTQLFHEAPSGEVCRFRTCYPIELWPISVEGAGFDNLTEASPECFTDRGMSRISVRIACDGGDFSELDPKLNRLRFYLNGEMADVARLYELMLNHVLEGWLTPISVEGEAVRGEEVPLGPECVSPVGFGRGECVLPYPEHAQPGYRLMQQYFTFPKSYMFLDVKGLRMPPGTAAQLDFVLDVPRPRRVNVTGAHFVLGCTPIVNLFDKVSEPIRVDHRASEYRLIADTRAEEITEVHSIRRVTGSSDTTRAAYSLRPLFSFEHGGAEADARYWHHRRIPTDQRDRAGTDIYLSFLNLGPGPQDLEPTTVYAHTVCTNRGLAPRLGGSFDLHLYDGGAIKQIRGLHRPTEPLYPGGDTDKQWRLISQLSLNQLSLDGPRGTEALREILGLYTLPTRPSTAREVGGIEKVRVEDTTYRVQGEDAWRGFARGLRVSVELDEEAFPAGNTFLFASVLRHFFGLYATANSFVKFRVTRRRQEEEWTWKPLTGYQTLI